MAYLPLARKYRPQIFADLIGQSHVTTTLSRAIESKRIGQAYLFAGQRGVGKTSAARILAKSLTCAKGPTVKPCQTCPSCTAISQSNSLDVVEIDGASNRGIDEVRALRETVKFAPTRGAYRIYIIDEVHMLTTEAFNALLKTLEEPPAHVKFIFATTALQKLPATILSRCQRFDFRRLDAKTIVSALQQISKAERIRADEAALYAIARSAEGSLRDAQMLLEQAVSFCEGTISEQDISRLLGAVEQEVLIVWAQAILERDASAALRCFSQQLEAGKEVTQVLVSLLLHLRNLLILRATAEAPSQKALLEHLLDVPEEHAARLEEQARHATAEEWLVMVQLLTGAYELARRSPFAQAVVELVLIKLATRESWASLEQMIQRLERLASLAPSASARAVQPHAPASAATNTQLSLSRRSTDASPEEPGEEGSLAIEHVAAQWPAVLERLGRRKMSLAAYLAETRPLSVTGDRLEVGIPGFALHQEVLTSIEHLRLIETVLQEVFGQPVHVRYATLPPPGLADTSLQTAAQPSGFPGEPLRSSTPEREAPPIVQEIVKLFNATLVNPPTAQS